MGSRITRRHLLIASTVTSLITSLAGCTGDGETPNGNEGDTDETEDSDNTDRNDHDGTGDESNGDEDETENEESSETKPVVELLKSEIISDDEGRKWIHAEFENPTEYDHGRVRVNHTVYTNNDEIVDSQETIIDLLPAGEKWRNYELVLGDRREEAESIESNILTEDGSLSSSEIESIDVTNSTLNQDYQSGTEIIGEIENGETEYSQVYLVGLIYTEEGVLRGSVGEIINNLATDEIRSFRAAIASNRTPPDREEALPTQHDLYVFDGIP